MGSRDLLKDRVLLVTGSTGIAAAAAELAAAEGARVFVVSRTPEHAESLARRIGGAFLAADLTRADSAERAVDACVARWGRLDALFNVAGVSGRPWGDGPVHECTDEGWDATLQANARSVFLMCRAAVRRMLLQDPGPDGLRGSILNMASVLAFSPQGRHFATHAYAASKGAILALSRAMAATYAPHKIRVNAVAPGLVRTPMSARAQADPQILALMKTKQPLSEDLLEAADVARAAIFLLGPDARAVTGDTLVVDGGWGVSG
ncbi:MAG TPA: SDR family oxidoreductase [Planctomycetota bacterium]|nr:SDR family oxidoreductase [Planctomycetota bacterium]